MSKKQQSQEASRRVGLVGISMTDRVRIPAKVAEVLKAENDIVKSMSMLSSSDERVVAVIIKATTDELGALTGKLGMVPGVKVKSVLF